MPEEHWPQVQAAHFSGQQPALIQAAATENLIQMTSSFLPSDLSGIPSFSRPPSPPPLSLLLHTHIHTPPIQPSHSLWCSLKAHPASVSLAVFLSHLISPSTTPPPVLPATLPPPYPPKGIIHCEGERSFKVKFQCVGYGKLCWVAPGAATVAALVWQHTDHISSHNQWVLGSRRCRRT